MNNDITNYPLAFPAGQPRTPAGQRNRARFQTRGISMYSGVRKHTIAASARELENEIRRMGGGNMIISSNLKVKANGLPYSNQPKIEDPGVAVYFKWHKRDLVFACDKWLDVEDNLWAIVKHIEALRGQERWGVGSLDQAFAGYMALPDPEARQWWEVLQIPPTADNETIKKKHRELSALHHPDRGGDPILFDQVQKAYNLAMGKIK